MLIVLEGMDGCGKSVHAKNLVKFINASKGKGSAILLREPGSTPASEAIRDVIMNYETEPMTDLLLFNAARHELVEKEIKPALEKGQIVVMDRFFPSSIAYQGAMGLHMDDIETAIDLAVGRVRPDYVFFLDVDVPTGLARKYNQNSVQKFEVMDLEYLWRVNSFYINMCQNNDNYIYIDTNGKTEDKVFWTIHNKLDYRQPYLI